MTTDNPTTTHDIVARLRDMAARYRDARLEMDAAAEIERLRNVIAWCHPRLKLVAYRQTLDDLMANPREPDHTPIVQSEINDR